MIKIGFGSSVGCKRENNEDAYLILEDLAAFAVADGVGGNKSGEVASSFTVEYIKSFMESENHLFSEAESIEAAMKECITQANAALFKKSLTSEAMRGMATTVVFAVIRDGWAHIVNVGDSRGYLMGADVLTQITEDHSFVNELIKDGFITGSEARNMKGRNVITKAIGGEARVEADYFNLPLENGDILLLCTDGLHGEVEDGEIAAIIKEGRGNIESLSETLIKKANAMGGRDNTTVICLEYTGKVMGNE